MAARRSIRVLAASLALVLSVVSGSLAQTIRGIIVDDLSGRPIQSAVVDLINAHDSILGQDITDVNGWFSIPLPDTATYQLRAGALGYVPTLSTAFALVEGQTVGAEIRMPVNPVSLEGLDAVVERLEKGLDAVGFYQRRNTGFGQVRDPADYRKHPPQDVSDLFRGVNGIRLVRTEALADWEIFSARRVFGDVCRPSVSIDFVIIQRGGRLRPLDADASKLERAVGAPRDVNRSFWQDLVTPQEVAAIEVYAGQGGLPDWVSGDVSPCGAVLIWTKGYVFTK